MNPNNPGTRSGALRTPSGFTLVEVLVAIVVGGIALAAGFGALSLLQERTSHAREAGTAVLAESAARELVLDWLSQATLELPTSSAVTPIVTPGQGGQGGLGGRGGTAGGGTQGLGLTQGRTGGGAGGQGITGTLSTSDQPTAPTSNFEGQEADDLTVVADELYFLTSGRTPLDLPTTFVRLYLDVDPLTPEQGWVAELTGRRLDEIPLRMELAPQATGVEIRFRPNIDGEEVEWQDGWVGQNTLPRGIEIRLSSDPANPLPDLLGLPIRVAIEATGSSATVQLTTFEANLPTNIPGGGGGGGRGGGDGGGGGRGAGGGGGRGAGGGGGGGAGGIVGGGGGEGGPGGGGVLGGRVLPDTADSGGGDGSR